MERRRRYCIFSLEKLAYCPRAENGVCSLLFRIIKEPPFMGLRKGYLDSTSILILYPVHFLRSSTYVRMVCSWRYWKFFSAIDTRHIGIMLEMKGLWNDDSSGRSSSMNEVIALWSNNRAFTSGSSYTKFCSFYTKTRKRIVADSRAEELFFTGLVVGYVNLR